MTPLFKIVYTTIKPEHENSTPIYNPDKRCWMQDEWKFCICNAFFLLCLENSCKTVYMY